MRLESFLIGSNEHILCNIKVDDNYLYTFCQHQKNYLYIPSSEKLYTYYLLHFPLHKKAEEGNSKKQKWIVVCVQLCH